MATKKHKKAQNQTGLQIDLPKGEPKIAQPFKAGYARVTNPSPEGTTELNNADGLVDQFFCRPFGTTPGFGRPTQSRLAGLGYFRLTPTGFKRTLACSVFFVLLLASTVLFNGCASHTSGASSKAQNTAANATASKAPKIATPRETETL